MDIILFIAFYICHVGVSGVFMGGRLRQTPCREGRLTIQLPVTTTYIDLDEHDPTIKT